jgi:hypothetical protein
MRSNWSVLIDYGLRLNCGEVIYKVAHFLIRDLQKPLAGILDGLHLLLDLGGHGGLRSGRKHYRRVRIRAINSLMHGPEGLRALEVRDFAEGALTI